MPTAIQPLPMACGHIAYVEPSPTDTDTDPGSELLLKAVPAKQAYILNDLRGLIVGKNHKKSNFIIDLPHIVDDSNVPIKGFATVNVQDLGSRLGIYVNGQRVSQIQPLRRRDIIEIKDDVTTNESARSLKFQIELYPMESIYAQYEFGLHINEGAYGVVSKVRKRLSGEIFAAKQIPYNYILPSGFSDKVKQEVQILQQLQHNNIVQFEAAFRVPGSVFLIMELMKYGDLHELVNQKGPLENRTSSMVIRQVCNALRYLHCDLWIAHRDIKASNVLIYKEEPLIIKVGDFGLAKALAPDEQYYKSVVGTPYYKASEIRGRKYGFEADGFSVGVLAFYMLAKNYPNDGSKDRHPGTTKWERLPESVHKDARGFLEDTLRLSPSARMKIADALSHPWLAVPKGNTRRM
ncbi:kinase-like domain-containing protein [Cytidiella melzeri]|nr:kinase-like domain-containing protein [Cytidiella melzeri]